MSETSWKGWIRTLVFLALAIPVVWYLIAFSMERNREFDAKAKACADQCAAKGFSGSEFKWAALSKAECVCLQQDE